MGPPNVKTGWDMGVYTHWGAAICNGGYGGESGRISPAAHNTVVQYIATRPIMDLCQFGGAEVGTEPIQTMVGEARSGYPGDKGGACSSGGGGGGAGTEESEGEGE